MPRCTDATADLARALGDFTCRDAPAIIHLRNPLSLSNGTLPILEAMMVGGAIFALVVAIRRHRRDGDPTSLALWIATVVYLFVIEIPLYFPDTFGLQDTVGNVFVHNVFTVEFLYDRLPLYIVALYPAVVTLAFDVVRRLGVFRDRGIVVGALCVGFVHHCLYEVFDHLGPQLRWWAWNTDNPLNHPMFASVPMTSVYIFATLGPIVVTALVMWLVGRRATELRGWRLVARILLAGVLVPVGLVVFSIPSSIFGGAEPNTTAQAVVFTVELAVVALVAVPVLISQWRTASPAGPPATFVRVFGPVYLGVLAVLWCVALPEHLRAVDGVTRDGTPIGCLPYVAVCFVAAGLVMWAAARDRSSVDIA